MTSIHAICSRAAAKWGSSSNARSKVFRASGMSFWTARKFIARLNWSLASWLADGVTASANHEANDQFNLAMNFLAVQNDIPLARKTFERALELDPHFAAARLQIACMLVIEIFNGHTNDGSVLYQAEEELHRAEQVLPGSDGLLLSTQAVVYLAQGRLDRIPLAK